MDKTICIHRINCIYALRRRRRPQAPIKITRACDLLNGDMSYTSTYWITHHTMLLHTYNGLTTMKKVCAQHNTKKKIPLNTSTWVHRLSISCWHPSIEYGKRVYSRVINLHLSALSFGDYVFFFLNNYLMRKKGILLWCWYFCYNLCLCVLIIVGNMLKYSTRKCYETW